MEGTVENTNLDDTWRLQQFYDRFKIIRHCRHRIQKWI